MKNVSSSILRVSTCLLTLAGVAQGVVTFSVDNSRLIVSDEGLFSGDDMEPMLMNHVHFDGLMVDGWSYKGRARFDMIPGGPGGTISEFVHRLTLTEFEATNMSGVTGTRAITFRWGEGTNVSVPAGSTLDLHIDGTITGPGGAPVGGGVEIFEWIGWPSGPLIGPEVVSLGAGPGGSMIVNDSSSWTAGDRGWSYQEMVSGFKVTLNDGETLELPTSATMTFTTPGFVPEPGTALLTLFGLAPVMARRRRA